MDAQDLELLEQVMKQVEEKGDQEILKAKETLDLFQRLQIKGSPVWGLSAAQRAFVTKFK